MSTTPSPARGISERNRKLLTRLHRGVSGPFTPEDATNLLSLDIRRARRFLAYLADRGWLVRVRRGLYAAVPLDAIEPGAWREDPWVVASKVFSPFYIGGWTACEHWGLTEQIFRETVVISGRSSRHREMEIHGFPFRIKVVRKERIFGTETVWRGRVRVPVSNPARTLVDVLDDPAIGGGMRHVAGVLDAYLLHERRDDSLLLDYAHKLGNRTVFKRLGFLMRVLAPAETSLIEACLKAISSGISLLDPTATSKGPIVKKWNLRVNVALESGATQ